jgi:hypothetical protein
VQLPPSLVIRSLEDCASIALSRDELDRFSCLSKRSARGNQFVSEQHLGNSGDWGAGHRFRKRLARERKEEREAK